MHHLYDEGKTVLKGVISVAEKMVIAALTAPKTRGINHIHSLLLTGNNKDKLVKEMAKIGHETSRPFFIRDSKNVDDAIAIVLIGNSIGEMDLPYCGYCGFRSCTEKKKHSLIPCAFNSIDLGIAAGSAVSIAMDSRVDNRIMYTAGIAAIDLRLFNKDVKAALGIPLSATGKNIFFDRK